LTAFAVLTRFAFWSFNARVLVKFRKRFLLVALTFGGCLGEEELGQRQTRRSELRGGVTAILAFFDLHATTPPLLTNSAALF